MKKVATPEEVWASIKELTDAQKASREEWDRKAEQRQQEWERESKQRQQEWEREAKQRQQEWEREAKQRQQEWDHKLEQSRKEAIRRQQERDRELKEARKRADRLENLFVGQWGKLMEQLVKGDFVKLLNQRNIKVERLSRDTSGKWNGEPYEFDIIATNGSEVVVAEVKTTLKVGDVDHFLEKLRHFKEMVDAYHDKKVYGAVAYLKVDEGAEVYSKRAGLFVIRAVGSSASVTNEQDFVPKDFG